MKRILSFLLALCLMGILPAAAASETPALTYRSSGNGVELTLEGVAEHVTALQAELVLEGACPNAVFTPASSSFYSPDCRVSVQDGKTTVTVYLVANDGALSGESLPLGTLTPGDSYRLPGQVDMKLLDQSLQTLKNVGQVPLSAAGGSSSGGSSSGGSSSGGSSSGGSSSSGGTSSSKTWRVQAAASEHGSVTAKPSSAAEGTTVTLTIVPDAGYTLESIRATDSRGRAVTLTETAANRRTFQMPAYDVEINAVFVSGSDNFVLPFQDIAADAWCYDAVRYVYENGLMNGTTTATFTPNATTTRGMIVAILYRLEGSPSAGNGTFRDVSASAYYASAVAWAAANGIVNGYSDGTFRPGNPITREQMAAFLFRYAGYKGKDVSQRADLRAFTDAGQVASYAVEAIQWANANGLVNGTSTTTLSPGGSATRAQVAVILTRFAKNVQS